MENAIENPGDKPSGRTALQTALRKLDVRKPARRMRALRASRKVVPPDWGDGGFIAHACGGFEGHAYTNSPEALSRSIAAGAKAIEIDFMFTTDGVLVCEHGWKEFRRKPRSLETFMSTPNLGGTSRMAARQALEMLASAGTAYLVVDTQEKHPERVHAEIQSILSEIGEEQFARRIVPEIYWKREHEALSAVYPYENWLMSLYKHKELTFEDFLAEAEFCAENGIDVIAMSAKRVHPGRVRCASELGLTVAAHTVNDPGKLRKLQRTGVKLFFTDTFA